MSTWSLKIGNQTSFAAPRLLEPFEFALRHGFGAFEWFPDKHGESGWAESDLSALERAKIARLAHQQEMLLSVHAPWWFSPFEANAAQQLEASIELAADLGAELVNIHLVLDRGVEAFAAAIRPAAQLLASRGSSLSVENTPLTGPEDFNELFALIGRKKAFASVGLCLDIGHANLCAATRNDYLGFIDRLGTQVPLIHLHAHENWGDRDSHLPLFTGPAAQDQAGIEGLLARLKKRRYGGALILEQWPQPPELLVQARDRLGRMIGALELRPARRRGQSV